MDVAPLDDATYAALRRAVFTLRRSTRARVFAPAIHVGLPDRPQHELVQPFRPDHTLRTDVVAGLLRMQDTETLPAAWLTRVGAPEPHDLDMAWLAAARAAFSEAGAPLPWFVVVTKAGWHRPATGEQRTWQRLRLR
jgi:hypothetical protein